MGAWQTLFLCRVKRNFQIFLFSVSALVLGFCLPAVGGLVDFSGGLLSYATKRFGRDATPRLLTWQKLVRDTRGADPGHGAAPEADLPSLRQANDFFNQVPYVSDMAHWRIEDYWATPVEMLGSFGGDCEDYAIAKYLTLKELGVPIARLRITYVRAFNRNESHMVLAYYPKPNAEPLILDNLVTEIRPASQRPDLEPVYSFNDDDLWLPTGASKKGGASQVRLWRELLEKLAKEQNM